MIDQEKVKTSFDRYIQNDCQLLLPGSLVEAMKGAECGMELVRNMYKQGIDDSFIFPRPQRQVYFRFRGEEWIEEMRAEQVLRNAYNHSLIVSIISISGRKERSRGLFERFLSWGDNKLKNYGYNQLYGMLESSDYYRNWCAIHFLTLMKEHGVEIDPFVSEQLERVEKYERKGKDIEDLLRENF